MFEMAEKLRKSVIEELVGFADYHLSAQSVRPMIAIVVGVP